MTGPLGRFCFPLMKNVADATYSANIISTAEKLKNSTKHLSTVFIVIEV
ncbi:unnamed protein product [Prunus armeniaca]|uniref:Uncharacterized protein n=1 Tax=Prunus armeniaca TaxID=36596 RepID=A0A6J5UNL6_PRUAR|nr:unnamed protein product [Prunus armeniaca]